MADQPAPVAVDLRGAAPGPAPAPARRVVVRRGRQTRRPQEDAAPAQPPPEADDEEAPPPVQTERQSGGDGTRRKRLTRFITLIVLTCLAAAVATTWYRAATYLADEVAFSAGWPLYIRVGGCDVDVKPGSSNSVETRTWVSRWVYPRYDYRSGSNRPWRIDVANAEGCHNAPGFACRDTCLVTIKVATPPSTLTFRSGADVGHPQRLRIEGVALDVLDVAGSFDVQINDALLPGKTRVTSSRGDVVMRDTSCGDFEQDCWLKATTGSVYYYEGRDILNALDIQYRSVNMRSCFALPDRMHHASGALPHTTAFKVAKHYDRDGNGKVTQEEFDVGIKKLGACLGGSCPLYSWSAAAKASVFASPDPSITTLFPVLSTAAFHAALVQANYSELQPATYRTLSITRITPTSGHNRSIRLEASSGEIRLELSNASNLTYVVPQDAAPLGARLLPTDAESLMPLRDAYGDASLLSNRDVFAVIDVAASPGVPADRWLYTSNEVYFELQPPLLDLISYGTVRPRVARFEVRLTDGEACAPGAAELDTDTKLAAARARVYEELRRTLKPRLQAELGGALARVKPRNQRDSFPRLASYARYSPTDPFHEEDYRRVMMRGRGRRAFNISLALAALATVWALVVGARYLGALHALADRNAVIQMRLRNAESERRSRAVASKEIISEEVDEEGLGIDSDALAWDSRGRFANFLNAPQWFCGVVNGCTELVTPLLRPIATIDAMVVAPIRRHFVDGRSKFFRMRCKVAHTRGVAPTETTECDLKIFTQAYRVFCPKKRLKADAFTTVGDTQRYLVAKHNLRLRTHKLPRLAGRVWTQVPAFIGDARPLVEHARCFAAAAEVNRILETATAEAKGDLATFLQERTRPAGAGVHDDDVVIGLVDEPVVLGEGAYGWKPGLLRVYDEWCLATGRPAVSRDILAGEIAAQGVAQSYRVAALGLELRNFPGGGGKGLRLPLSFYFEHVVSVLLHVTVFVLPAIWVIWICMMFQFRHAKLGGYVVADDARREHAWSPYDTDIVRRYFAGSGIQGGVVAGVVLAYLVVAWIVLVVEYIGDGVPPGSDWHTCWARSPPLPRPLHHVIKWCFVLVTLPFALLPFSLILAAIWVLGSAILDPNQFLARTAAFAALVTTLTSIGNQLRGAAAAKAKSVRDQLRGRLSAVLETWLREHRDATAKSSGKADDVATRAKEQVAFAKQVAGANDDVQALCAVLDADGSGGISRRELGALVALLDVPTFDHAKVDQVFAYANENLDAVISPAEFEAAWTWVENEVVDAALEAAGLTDRFITAAIGTALVLLLGLFIFIFQLVYAWSEGGTFGAVVESLLIAATAFSVRYLPSSRRVLPEAMVRKAQAKDV